MRPSPLSTALLLAGLLAACETPTADAGAATATEVAATATPGGRGPAPASTWFAASSETSSR